MSKYIILEKILQTKWREVKLRVVNATSAEKGVA